MFIKFISLICLSAFMFASCSRDFSSLQEKKQPVMRPLSVAEQQLVQTSQNFGLKLFKEINQQDQDKNLFISPLSVSMALGMTLNGASGETYEAMRQTLDFGDLSEQEINEAFRSLIDLLLALDPKVIMEIANSIWHRHTFNVLPDFLQTNQNYFNAQIAALDFDNPAAKDVINNWVAEKTHDKITKIIDAIPPEIVMYLINAIYFKGTWTYEFDEQNTKADVFHNQQQSIDCQMMSISGNWLYHEDESVQIIDLPYGDSLFSMTVFLPKTNSNIDDFIGGLNTVKWNSYLSSLKTELGALELPKFKMEYELTMNDVLCALGMSIAFNEYQANFSRINPNVQLFISYVLHKTFVQVDEEGTEAAAVTVVGVDATSVGDPHGFYMRVDRPFFFVIRERAANTILFMGKIIEPEWKE